MSSVPDSHEVLPHDGLGVIAAYEGTRDALDRERSQVAEIVSQARERAADLTAQAELVERVYGTEFLQDAKIAADLATALASGNVDVAFDSQSLGEHGDNPNTVRQYLREFIVQDPSVKYSFPQLTFPATAVIPYKDQEYHVSRLGNPLTSYLFSPSFTPDISLPVLVDPHVRTFAEFGELEVMDPGHARQLLKGYEMAAREQMRRDGRAHFREPKIVRMVAVLPTGYDYLTDFVPQVAMPGNEEGVVAWDPRLLVNGALNPAGDYLSNRDHFPKNKVVLNKDDREAALRVHRPLPGEVAADRERALVPLADHEMHSMAVILFPYEIGRQERSTATVPEPRRLIFEATKGTVGNVGGAAIGAGSSGIFGANKHDKTIFGDGFIPKWGGQPIIYSVRLLTAQRDPDVV